MFLKCPTYIGLRTVNELLKWEDLYQLISPWCRTKCHHYPVWEQDQPIIYHLMVAKMMLYLEFLVFILRLHMESCRVHFCFATVS